MKKEVRKIAGAVALSIIVVSAGRTGVSFAATYGNLKKAKVSANLTMVEGTKKNIIIKKVPGKTKCTYRSVDPSIAKVSKKGKVTALKEGTVTIKVKLSYKKQKLKKNCVVRVVKGSEHVGTEGKDSAPNTPGMPVAAETPAPSQNATAAPSAGTTTAPSTQTSVPTAGGENSSSNANGGALGTNSGTGAVSGQTPEPTATSGEEGTGSPEPSETVTQSPVPEETPSVNASASKAFVYSEGMADPVVHVEYTDGTRVEYEIPVQNMKDYAKDKVETIAYSMSIYNGEGELISKENKEADTKMYLFQMKVIMNMDRNMKMELVVTDMDNYSGTLYAVSEDSLVQNVYFAE